MESLNHRDLRGLAPGAAGSSQISEVAKGSGCWRLPSLHLLFMLFGLIGIPCIAYVTPPFQVSDELSHYQRADLIRLGRWVGERRGAFSGGVVSTRIGALAEVFWPLVLHPERRVTPVMTSKAATIDWDGSKNYQTFENTSIYPPHFYLPSALGIEIGTKMRLSVAQTLVLSRVLTGLTAVGIGTAAIAMAGSAALWIFALLTLPMSMSSMASVSQEALLLATASLAAGLYIANVRRERAGRYDFALLCAALAAIAMGRLPYVALALLPLAIRNVSFRTRLIGCGAIVAATITWSLITSKFAYVKFGIGDANARDQIAFLLANPGRIPGIVWKTFSIDGALLIESFVGRLGWLDLWLPTAYHVAAWVVLGVAAVCVTGWPHASKRASPLITASAVLLSFGAIFGALYLSWCPVGFEYAGGAQGRYFIPLALFLPAMLPPPRRREVEPRLAGLAKVVVAVFPIVSFAVVLTGLADRYYW